MKKNILLLVMMLVILSKITSLQAQPVVTEYVLMHPSFRIDLKDDRIQKMITPKSILDIDWNAAKRTLAVSYYLRKANIQVVVQALLKISETPAPIEQKNENKAIPVTPF